MGTDRFSKKKSETTPAAKKSDKKIIVVKDKEFDKNLLEVAKLRKELDSVKSKLAVAEGNLKPECINLFVEEYQSNGSYPGSFIIESNSAKMMLVPMDGYKKLTEESFNMLNEKYGVDQVTEEVTEWVMDDKIIQKYGKVISEALDKIPSSKMSEEDKDKLIIAKVSYIVKKGTIEKALTIGKGLGKPKKGQKIGEVGQGNVSVQEFRDDVDNTIQLKNCEQK